MLMIVADPERLLDQLADGAQASIAEVLVLVEVLGDRLPRHADRLGCVVLDLDLRVLRHAEPARQQHQLLDEGDHVLVRQRAHIEVDVETEARVQLVAADARQVVALGIEEELVEQSARVVNARRLTGTLLLEQLNERALL
jgi:hypothetical protein